MKQHKKELRKYLLQKRQNLSVKQWQTQSKQICCNLEKNSLFTQANTVLAYFSFRQEPDLSYLIKQTFLNKQWGFPRCTNNILNWHLWQCPQKLKPNKYNILEPLIISPKIQPQQVDLILVPTVACDRFGYRLGYGGGYYDRLLNDALWHHIPTIGITFDFAYLPQLPVEPWDIKLNFICTESLYVKIN